MNNFEKLTASEQELFLKFPAYISLLAVNWNGKLNAEEKETAMHFTHLKTFTCDPFLKSFYKAADKVFEANLNQLENDLPKDRVTRDLAIIEELGKLDRILNNFDDDYTDTMHRSMKSFKEHVSKANHSVLESFVFPIPIKGITE